MRLNTIDKPRVLVTGVPNNCGGTETVVSRFIGKLSDDFAFDTISHAPYIQDEFTMGDNRVVSVPARRMHPIAYEYEMRKFFREHGDDYSILWHNANSFSNIDPLVLAARAGIPARICHFHNTQILGNSLNKVLSEMHKADVGNLTTLRLACSAEAGKFAFGDKPYEVLNNAFDIAAFAYDLGARKIIRNELQLGDHFVIGTVGRLTEQKNQVVLIQALPDILKRRPDALLVIVGDGPLKSALEEEARTLGVEASVMFAGARNDVISLLSAFDVFAFPSIFEGLGVAVVEAQANGLPCVISDQVPSAAIVSSTASVIPADTPRLWSEKICAATRLDFKLVPELMAKYDIGRESLRLAAFLSGDKPAF